MSLILAIDQGTTNTKALLVDRSGRPVFRTSAPVALLTTREGFVEQDPRALWDSVLTVCAKGGVEAKRTHSAIEAIAISNQRETAVAWSATTGKPSANAIGWQCGRSEALCGRIADRAEEIRTKTGLPLAPLISAS